MTGRGPKRQLQEPGERLGRGVAGIGPEESCAADHTVQEKPGRDEAARFAVQRGKWYVQSRREVREGVLLGRVQQ